MSCLLPVIVWLPPSLSCLSPVLQPSWPVYLLPFVPSSGSASNVSYLPPGLLPSCPALSWPASLFPCIPVKKTLKAKIFELKMCIRKVWRENVAKSLEAKILRKIENRTENLPKKIGSKREKFLWKIIFLWKLFALIKAKIGPPSFDSYMFLPSVQYPLKLFKWLLKLKIYEIITVTSQAISLLTNKLLWLPRL